MVMLLEDYLALIHKNTSS